MCLCLLLCLLCSATRFYGATLGLAAWQFFTHPLPLTSMADSSPHDTRHKETGGRQPPVFRLHTCFFLFWAQRRTPG